MIGGWDCAKHGHTARVEGRPGNFTSYYVCSTCGAWRRRWPNPDGAWHGAFEPMPPAGTPVVERRGTLTKKLTLDDLE